MSPFAGQSAVITGGAGGIGLGIAQALVARGHDALHPRWTSTSRALVESLHDADRAVNVWTCDDPERMRELADWGVDGICTNVPDVALRALRGR